MNNIDSKLTAEAEKMQRQLASNQVKNTEKSFFKKTLDYLFISDYEE